MAEHYGCVVNLLGKAGYLKEAENLISSMPMKPKRCCLGCTSRCLQDTWKRRAVEGRSLGKSLLDLEPENSGRYTFCQTHSMQRQGNGIKAQKVRTLMKERGVKTVTGRSIIDLNGVVHEFKAGDSSRPLK
ncbi:UNVERIFIED_CONTAM: Pentatricopeptide repeat-containing protein [Sesamum angustifolium]|uniref:Pentatricopeptide repeat-containing protein n=1 Tax=Sesamum angustifolium TaxID=2727405 RepID=A0AAW2QB60_9LAMI